MEFRTNGKFLAVLITVAGILGTGCRSQDEAADAAGNHRAADDRAAVPVTVTAVQSADVADRLELTGSLRPLRQAVLTAQVAGEVKKVYVELGDPVEKEAPLVQIDPRTYELAVEQARANFRSARAAYEKAKADYDRNRRLHQSGDVSDFVLESARVQLASAEAAYQSAEAALKMAQKQLDDTLLKAPFAGTVASVPVDPGNTVAPGTPLVTVVDIRRLRLQVGVSEQDISRLRRGQRCIVTLDVYPGVEFRGKIVALGPAADPQTKTFPIKIDLPNSRTHPLRAGMVAKATIIVKMYNQVAVVPLSAILKQAEAYHAFVVSDNRAYLRKLVLGPRQGERVAVLSGVRAGEWVVTRGQDQLSDGAPVRIVEQN